MKLFGVWLPFAIGGQHWLKDVAGFDLVTPDESHAREAAWYEKRDAFVAPYDHGHHFHGMFGVCCACKATPDQAKNRWCPHSNPPIELEIASVARALWETDDRVAAFTIEAAEGRDPPLELLDRLFDRDIGGLRSEAEERAKAMR